MKIGIVGCGGRMGRMLIAEVLRTKGAKLGGACNGPGPFANLPATGKIDGDDVSFGFSISQPVSLTLLHRGKLDGAGAKVEGELDLMGNLTPFVATRRP